MGGIADSRACRQCGSQPVVLVDRKVRPERNRFLVFVVHVNELPGVLRPPERQGEQPVRQEILRRPVRPPFSRVGRYPSSSSVPIDRGIRLRNRL
jgi:hypothetical protein